MRLPWVGVHGDWVDFFWYFGFRIFTWISCTLVMIFTVIYFDVLAKKEHVIYLLIYCYIILFILCLNCLFYLYFLSYTINYSLRMLFLTCPLRLFLKLSLFYLWNFLERCLFISGLVIDLCIGAYFFGNDCFLQLSTISTIKVWFPRRQIPFLLRHLHFLLLSRHWFNVRNLKKNYPIIIPYSFDC